MGLAFAITPIGSRLHRQRRWFCSGWPRWGHRSRLSIVAWLVSRNDMNLPVLWRVRRLSRPASRKARSNTIGFVFAVFLDNYWYELRTNPFLHPLSKFDAWSRNWNVTVLQHMAWHSCLVSIFLGLTSALMQNIIDTLREEAQGPGCRSHVLTPQVACSAILCQLGPRPQMKSSKEAMLSQRALGYYSP